MIKKVCLTLLLALVVVWVHAQDYIVLTNGNVIKAKVVKIEGDIISYQNYDTQDGPVLTIFSRDVLSINYENGTVQSFAVTAPQQTHESMQTAATPSSSSNNDSWKQMERQRLYSAANSWKTVGEVFGTLGLIGGIAGGIYLGIVSGNAWYGSLGVISGILSGLFWIWIFNIPANNLRAQASTLVYAPMLQYDFQLESSTLSTSLGAMSITSAIQPGGGFASSTPGLGAGLSFSF